MSLHKLAYVVPTMDRPDDLRKLLESLAVQSVLPEQIIIVDASNPPIQPICDDYRSLPITYVREFPPSLARQRNAGMAALNDNITVAGYLDDDLELAPDATERMTAFWNGAGAEVGGAAFAIVNQPVRSPPMGFLADLFLLNSSDQGRVLDSSFASSIGVPESNLKTDWLYGGATLWRRDVIERFTYDEWYIGHGYLEDVDFSYRVSRTHELWVIADSRVWHWPRPILKSKNFTLGVQQVVNRVYLFRKIGSFSRASLVWALFGQCVLNIAHSIWRLDGDGFRRFLGNIKGFALVAGGSTSSVQGIWK